jgi:hypothetical protein
MIRPYAIDFRALFEGVPRLFLALAPDPPRFTILAVTDDYLQATLTVREGPRGIVGRGLFEVFPDPPNDPTATGTRNLRASLERALAYRAPDIMEIQHYDIQRPDGTWEERHWAPCNSPVLGPDGAVDYLLHEVADVTKLVQAEAAEQAARAAVEKARVALKAARADLQREQALVHDAYAASERLRAESDALRAELRQLLTQSGALRSQGRGYRRRNSS